MVNKSDKINDALTNARYALDALEEAVAQGTSSTLKQREDELIAVLTQLVDLVSGLAEAPPEGVPPTCNACARRETCKTPCDRVADILPGAFAGRGRREHLVGLQPNLDTDNHRDTTTDRFFIFLNQAHLFTPRQWRVIQLYYGDGKTEADIAKQLNISPASVSERLKRAKRRFELGRLRNFTKKPE